MLFYYVRHGEPIYDPDSLTPHGEVQAESLSGRLSGSGLDRIFASTSNRAVQTAFPTCRKLQMEPVLLDFANEHYAWLDFAIPKEDGSGCRWVFQTDWAIELFASREIRDMGDRWFEHPAFKDYNFKSGIDRVYREVDSLFESLGYKHERYTGKYKIVAKSDERVALFAHQGFGLLFLSCLLDIPYPQVCTHFDMCHTGVTVIEFLPLGDGEYCIPKMLTLSSDGHLYKDGIPSNYGF